MSGILRSLSILLLRFLVMVFELAVDFIEFIQVGVGFPAGQLVAEFAVIYVIYHVGRAALALWVVAPRLLL
jgi:hypothetical protein